MSPSYVRPVRSTRNQQPVKYKDYDLDFLLLVKQGACFDEPHTYEEAIARSDSQEWRFAMQTEYESFIANQVWRVVDRLIMS